MTHRRAVDGRVFRRGLVLSVALHGVALGFLSLPVTVHERHPVRAPLLAIEMPSLVAVELPEQAARRPTVAEDGTPAVAIPVPVAEVTAETITHLADLSQSAAVRTPYALPDRSARPAADSLAGVVVPDQYEQEIARWVERHRDYPLVARRRGIEGTAIVLLRLRTDGMLLGAQIVRDTGHAVLDRAALGMVERAAPFPGLPGAFGGEVEVLVPIQFTLGR